GYIPFRMAEKLQLPVLIDMVTRIVGSRPCTYYLSHFGTSSIVNIYNISYIPVAVDRNFCWQVQVVVFNCGYPFVVSNCGYRAEVLFQGVRGTGRGSPLFWPRCRDPTF